jgi:mannose-1-phosphate guanylyltransferase
MDGVVGMVLAAGLGTRLRPLTDLLPKPAVPVAGLPVVQFAFARLRAAGARRVVVNAHHLATDMERVAAGSAEAAGVALAVSREPVIAGTGGALREARALLAGAGAIVLWNGDILFDVDLAAVVAAHRESGALATMVLAPMPEGAGYATVDVDQGMLVRRIAGIGPGGEALVPLHFTGVHVLSPALLDHVPGHPFACDVNRSVYPPLLAAGRVHAVVAGGYWNDLGTPERYLEANLDLLSGKATVPLPGADPLSGAVARAGRVFVAEGASVDPSARLRGPVLVAAGAALEAGAIVGPGAVLGEGSRVGPGASVERAVVWPGTVIAPGERLSGVIAAGALRVLAG